MIERILVVGLGRIGKRHLRIVRDLMPIADIRVLRHSECREIPGTANGCFSTIEEATDFLPQIAVVANPAPFHISIAMDLVTVGCHLLIEKPMSVDTNPVLVVCVADIMGRLYSTAIPLISSAMALMYV